MWCVPQKKVSFEPTTSYLLKNLKPFSAYTFQLAARSKHGIGAYTNEVSVDTPQTRKSGCNDGFRTDVCLCAKESADNAKRGTDPKKANGQICEIQVPDTRNSI